MSKTKAVSKTKPPKKPRSICGEKFPGLESWGGCNLPRNHTDLHSVEMTSPNGGGSLKWAGF